MRKKIFKSLEDKIKIVISECNSKTLKRVDDTFLPDGIRNANYGEQHVLKNGLNVYIFFIKIINQLITGYLLLPYMLLLSKL